MPKYDYDIINSEFEDYRPIRIISMDQDMDSSVYLHS